MLYETPPSIVQAVQKHVPLNAKVILDPAVGHGALVQPLVLKGRVRRVVGIDCSATALENCKNTIKSRKLSLLKASFLKLPLSRMQLVDCVVMNPPFAGRKDAWHQCGVTVAKFLGVEPNTRLPVEILFVVRALALLKDQGRLISILPRAFLHSKVYEPLRQCLYKVGSPARVYEIPMAVFENAQTTACIVVFDKGKVRKSFLLCNHSLNKPHKISVPIQCNNLSYEFHEAREKAERLIDSTVSWGWMALGDYAEISRGNIVWQRQTRILHTCHYRGGFWAIDGVVQVEENSNIALPRVCRNWFQRAGLILDRNLKFSECMIALSAADNPLSLLFAVRAVLTYPEFRGLYIMGSTANYVTLEFLRSLKMPIKLSERAPALFRAYKEAVDSRDYGGMLKIESCLWSKFDRCIKAA